MKKMITAAVAAAMLLLTACSGSQGTGSGAAGTPSNVTEQNSANTSESTAPVDSADSDIDYSKLSEEEIYDLMVERSLMTTGDMTRMANVLKKAENGEEITVSYIGGSITEGLTVAPSEPELCWAYLSYKWLCEKYPNAKINFVNAGLSGTPSILGNVRLERDILAHKPDICFVEFAVNDGMESKYKNAYESLVRTLLSQENDMAVVLLFTVIESGHTCQAYMSQIGSNYKLPMISEPDSLGVEFSEGRMTWQDYSDDRSHPNKRGHEIVRDFVANYYEKVIETLDDNVGEVDKTLPAPVFSDRYENMHYIDSEKLKPELVNFTENDTHTAFHKGWSYMGDQESLMKFTLKCKSLQMIFKANKSVAYASADVYVDGELAATVNSRRSDGWDNPETELVIDNDEAAEHTVEIKVAGGKKHIFSVLGFGYCD